LVRQELPPQYFPLTQSVSAVQLVLQAVEPQTYGEQLCVPLPTQVPEPLHVSAFVSTPPEHEDALHTVPEA